MIKLFHPFGWESEAKDGQSLNQTSQQISHGMSELKKKDAWIHSLKLTWHLPGSHPKRNLIFQPFSGAMLVSGRVIGCTHQFVVTNRYTTVYYGRFFQDPSPVVPRPAQVRDLGQSRDAQQVFVKGTIPLELEIPSLGIPIKAWWWFQICFIFIPTWGNDPIWLIFFKWVETTNLKVVKSCLSVKIEWNIW